MFYCFLYPGLISTVIIKNTLIMVEIAIFPNVLPRSFYYPNNVPFLYIPILTFHQNEESIPEYSDCRNENQYREYKCAYWVSQIISWIIWTLETRENLDFYYCQSLLSLLINIGFKLQSMIKMAQRHSFLPSHSRQSDSRVTN